jgi:hypothetical protein
VHTEQDQDLLSRQQVQKRCNIPSYPEAGYRRCHLKEEVERLCKIGVLRKTNNSEWAAQGFAVPKKEQTDPIHH